jgi:predicted nucleic acid-binding protein
MMRFVPQRILRLAHLTRVYVEKILEICRTGHIKSGFPSFYDACYHALAMIHDCHFITADKRHFSKTHQLGNIVLLSDWQAVLL